MSKRYKAQAEQKKEPNQVFLEAQSRQIIQSFSPDPPHKYLVRDGEGKGNEKGNGLGSTEIHPTGYDGNHEEAQYGKMGLLPIPNRRWEMSLIYHKSFGRLYSEFAEIFDAQCSVSRILIHWVRNNHRDSNSIIPFGPDGLKNGATQARVRRDEIVIGPDSHDVGVRRLFI